MEQSDNHPHPTFHELGFVFESHRQSEIGVKLSFSLLENFVIFHIGLFAISDYCISYWPYGPYHMDHIIWATLNKPLWLACVVSFHNISLDGTFDKIMLPGTAIGATVVIAEFFFFLWMMNPITPPAKFKELNWDWKYRKV